MQIFERSSYVDDQKRCLKMFTQERRLAKVELYEIYGFMYDF